MDKTAIYYDPKQKDCPFKYKIAGVPVCSAAGRACNKNCYQEWKHRKHDEK